MLSPTLTINNTDPSLGIYVRRVTVELGCDLCACPIPVGALCWTEGHFEFCQACEERAAPLMSAADAAELIAAGIIIPGKGLPS